MHSALLETLEMLEHAGFVMFLLCFCVLFLNSQKLLFTGYWLEIFSIFFSDLTEWEQSYCNQVPNSSRIETIIFSSLAFPGFPEWITAATGYHWNARSHAGLWLRDQIAFPSSAIDPWNFILNQCSWPVRKTVLLYVKTTLEEPEMSMNATYRSIKQNT